MSLRPIALMLLLTLFAGALGGWCGVTYGQHMAHSRGDLDTLVHHDLDLTADQDRQIETLEAGFAARRLALEAEMRAANRDLAEALDREHKIGPQALAAVDRFHHAEKALEIATIEHVLAMRAVLTPDQTKKFDTAIHRALTAT